jgi:hypothetical protein
MTGVSGVRALVVQDSLPPTVREVVKHLPCNRWAVRPFWKRGADQGFPRKHAKELFRLGLPFHLGPDERVDFAAQALLSGEAGIEHVPPLGNADNQDVNVVGLASGDSSGPGGI